MLKGNHVYLRQPVIEDAALWFEWLNDFDVVLPLGDEFYSKVTMESVEEQIRNNASSDCFMFSIIIEEDKVIGRCMLFNIDRVNGSAMVGIFIGDKEQWGKGYAKEAMELLIEYSFRIQNLHSLMLGVYCFNTRAIALYEKLGFKAIGIRREVRKIDGKYHNAILMDLLEDEYENKHIAFGIQ